MLQPLKGPASARAPAVCSWSLQPSSPADLVAKVRACGLKAVQLALDPIRRSAASAGPWDQAGAAGALADARVGIISGMMAFEGEDYSTLGSIRRTGGVRLDQHWIANLAAARANAVLAKALGIGLVTFHAGFIPHDRSSPERPTMIGRLRAVIDVFADQGVRTAFETGQETAETLLDALDELDRPGVGVNFDPANMILYGMGDPVAALRRLLPRVVQVHVKDAVPAHRPGEWGREVPAGSGAVDWAAFFEALDSGAPGVAIAIEREAGGSRIDDIRAAADLIARRGR